MNPSQPAQEVLGPRLTKGEARPARGGQLRGDGAEVIQRAADLDQAVMQLVHGLGVLVGILILLQVDDVDAEIIGAVLAPCASGRRLVTVAEHWWRREQSVDGEIDRRVDDDATGPQLRGLVIDREHRVLPMLRQHDRQCAQAGSARQLAAVLVQRDPPMVLQREQDGALDTDLLGVRRRQAVEGVLGIGTERAEPSGEVRFAVLQPPQVGGEAGEVAAGGAVVALGLGLKRAAARRSAS